MLQYPIGILGKIKMRFLSKKKLPAPKKTALVLGSGGARGWAHIGVLQALAELNVTPDIVVGSSIGSIVGAIYATGTVSNAAELAPRLSWMQVAKLFFEFGISRSGLIEGKRIMRFLEELIHVKQIEHLPLAYAVVATDLHTHQEVVLKSGDILEAIRASIAIPGIFTPVHHEKQWLVDGGLVNPLPVSVARAMGADYVIGVDINLRSGKASEPKGDKSPFLPEVITHAFRVAENSITRERLLRQPPDVLIQPEVGHIATLDFHCGVDAIRAGYDATMEKKEAIRKIM